MLLTMAGSALVGMCPWFEVGKPNSEESIGKTDCVCRVKMLFQVSFPSYRSGSLKPPLSYCWGPTGERAGLISIFVVSDKP